MTKADEQRLRQIGKEVGCEAKKKAAGRRRRRKSKAVVRCHRRKTNARRKISLRKFRRKIAKWDRKSILTDSGSGYTKPWKFALVCRERDYDKLLLEDVKLKAELKDKLKSAGVSSVEIERPGNKLRIIIKHGASGHHYRAQGRGNRQAEDRMCRSAIPREASARCIIDIQEVHKPELDAQLVAESIALQLEKRVGFRRAMRKSVDSALRFGCKGIKVRVSGRLNGNEIARSEWYLQGRLPLHTLRADIDYGFTEARTTYGVIGVKCWVYKGEILPVKKREATPAREVVTTGAF